jgi:glycerol-3-phosphate dehydrogenase (NAD(P)+)
MARIAIMGSGGWGSAMGMMLARHGHEVTLWSLFQEEVDTLNREREHKKLLAGVKYPDSVVITTDVTCCQRADIVIMAVPSFAVRSTAKLLRDYIPQGQIVVNIAKGLEEDTLERLSTVIQEEMPHIRFVAMSGPSHAEEVARGLPTTNVVGSTDREAASYVQEQFMNEVFRIYTSDDVVGMEIGAALKNVIAICAGVCDGMGFGDNTKAALMTRGMAEITRLGLKMGGKPQTFAGLSGIGDLIVTCTSMHSRNRRAGILIGQGKTAQQAIDEVGMVVEGYKTAHAAYLLAQKMQVEMPIVNETYQVLYQGKEAKQAIIDLMTRSKKDEKENWFGFMHEEKEA